MAHTYEPPSLGLSDTPNHLYQEGDRRNISGASQFNKWTQIEKQKATYYGKLTNYLLFVFSVRISVNINYFMSIDCLYCKSYCTWYSNFPKL